MDNGKHISKVQCGDDSHTYLSLLMARTFPYLTEGTIDETIKLCEQNDGLVFSPEEKPDFVFGYWRFYPALIDEVRICDWGRLCLCDLRWGPLLYIAVLITPTPGYRLARELIDELNPLGVCCHRYRETTQDFDFRFKLNKRFDPERLEAHG